ncbi:MAG: 3-deoxy-7-phosphoheptulonate synthase [Chloroflexota bacterium]|nr:MAG: 3-deoxy-7-phosphoheptulonate synthase [Chloroflexota bacterium]
MIISMKLGATQVELDDVMKAVETSGFRPFLNPGVERQVVAVLGEVDIDKVELMDQFSNMAGVERVQLISEPFKLSSRQAHPGPFSVSVGEVSIGGTRIVVIAGPCSVESESQVLETARAVKASGARLLRGGAFKPRSSPHSFQGLGEKGLKMLATARAETGLPIVTEVMDPHDLDVVCRYADMLQIGARNMQNFSLLRWTGQTRHPVLLKRGPGSRIRDFLMAAEYILAEGNPNVVLCERGIISFEDASRYTTDINAIPILKGLTHLPVILDPSHATGNWAWVKPIALAGIAAGADGLIVEVHPDPQHARSDGKQSLKPSKFADLMAGVARVAPAVDRSI